MNWLAVIGSFLTGHRRRSWLACPYAKHLHRFLYLLFENLRSGLVLRHAALWTVDELTITLWTPQQGVFCRVTLLHVLSSQPVGHKPLLLTESSSAGTHLLSLYGDPVMTRSCLVLALPANDRIPTLPLRFSFVL